MNNSSYFIKDKAMFGSFPTQNSVDELEQEGVRYFVDLTFPNEKKIVPYTTNYTYLRFSISDCRPPRYWKTFANLIIKLSDTINHLGPKERIYIHCKGGHGRSGVVVACLLCHMFNMEPDKALQRTTMSHNSRIIMRDKWRKIGSPQTYNQKNFVYKFFSPLRFYRAFRHGHTAGFSTFTTHSVNVKGLGTFPTAEAAIQAHRAPHDAMYVKQQEEASSPMYSLELGGNVVSCDDWDDIEPNVVYEVNKMKFDQHPYLQNSLLNTGLRRITHCQYYVNATFGDENIIGNALVKLREYYHSEIEM